MAHRRRWAWGTHSEQRAVWTAARRRPRTGPHEHRLLTGQRAAVQDGKMALRPVRDRRWAQPIACFHLVMSLVLGKEGPATEITGHLGYTLR